MKKINILLLEDSRLDADLIRKELEEEGLCFNLTRIETETDFIKHVKKGIYDIILSDYNLPQFDGLTALQITQELDPSLPFIIVTGSLSEEVAAQCIQRGAWDYVVKERLFRLSSSINKCLALNVARTSSRQAEETRKKYDFIINTVNIPMSLINLEYEYEAVNEAYCRMLILERENIIGRTIFDIWPNRESADKIKRMLDACFRGKEIKEADWIEIPGGTTRFREIHFFPYRNEAGEITHAVIVSYDITDLKQAEQKIKNSLEEKEVLIKEIHHRVKNNLQIISSMLHMQSRYIPDKSSLGFFLDSVNRVKSMALIHENLYQSHDLNNVNFSRYLDKLISNLFLVFHFDDKKITFKKILQEDISININLAVPAGLIINELLSNSLKYAFPEGKNGFILLEMKFADKTYHLTIEDNGIGLPEGFDYRNSNTLGLLLVHALVRQIHGEMEIARDPGTKFTIHFPEF